MRLCIKTKTPAKINCFLRITGRLANGYHTIYSLFRKITLWDLVFLGIDEAKGQKSSITVNVQGNPTIPVGQGNIAYRAAELFLNETGANLHISIQLDKHIPAGAGLGGGSSDASCVLKTLNDALGCPISQERLLEMARELGADCPFFIHEAPSCVATGIGDILKPVHLPTHHYLLIMPDIHVDTGWAYGHFVLTNSEVEISFVPEKLGAFMHWVNDFEAVVFTRFPVLKRYRDKLLEVGAKVALMTGSGSTIFGLFDSKQRALEAIVHLRRELGPNIPRMEVVDSL